MRNSQVSSGQFGSASDYIVALVATASKKRSSPETALPAGLESGPAAEWTCQEWQDIRQRVSQRNETG
jgi:Arc/MetJ-type ribon-helix-helix transcriptional regulator